MLADSDLGEQRALLVLLLLMVLTWHVLLLVHAIWAHACYCSLSCSCVPAGQSCEQPALRHTLHYKHMGTGRC